MKVSKKAAARTALIAGLEAQVASLTVASQPTYGMSRWVEARASLAAAKDKLAALAASTEELEAVRTARLQQEAEAKVKRAALHASRVNGVKGPRLALVDLKTCLARKAQAIKAATAMVATLQDRAAAFAFHAAVDQENFGQAAEMAASRRNRAERKLADLVATSAMAFWK